MNKIEALKAEKDGLDVTDDLVRFAREGWKTIADDDKERLKWVGRLPPQAHARALHDARPHAQRHRDRRAGAPARRDHAKRAGPERSPTSRRASRCSSAGSPSRACPRSSRGSRRPGSRRLQTGMDNIRGIIGCPATGLTPRSSSTPRAIAARVPARSSSATRTFTNLPRKFNVTITGCLEHCTGGETQDISMTPAIAGRRRRGGRRVQRRRRRQAGIGRTRASRRPSTPSCAPRRRPTAVRGDRADLPRSRAARGAQQAPGWPS